MRQRATIDDARLERTRKALAEWRARRQHRAPIPEPLWRSAMALAREYGTSRIANELRVNYMRLRARLAEAPQDSPPTEIAAARPAFLELAVAPTDACAECTIEIEKRGGDRLTMRLKGQHGAEFVAALGRVFLAQDEA